MHSKWKIYELLIGYKICFLYMMAFNKKWYLCILVNAEEVWRTLSVFLNGNRFEFESNAIISKNFGFWLKIRGKFDFLADSSTLKGDFWEERLDRLFEWVVEAEVWPQVLFTRHKCREWWTRNENFPDLEDLLFNFGEISSFLSKNS